MTDDGHRYSFAAPTGGWPSFDKDGRRITTHKPDGSRAARIIDEIDKTLDEHEARGSDDVAG